jgi:putative hemolysin
MEQNSLIQVIEMAILLAFSAFFGGAETAFFSLTRRQVRGYRESKSLIANLIYRIASRPRSLLATVLLGNMISSVMFASMAFLFAQRLQHRHGAGPYLILVNILALFVLIIFGEVAPKTVAVRIPAAVAKMAAVPFFFMQTLVVRVAWLFARVTGRREFSAGADRAVLSATELKQILSSGARGGEFGKRVSRLVSEIMDFRDIKVREVMVPRVDVLAFRKADSMDNLIALIGDKKVKNIPVFGHYKDDIVGIISAKDVFSSSAKDPAELIRPVLVVPENKSVESMLIEFQREHQKFAVVVSEYGGMEGIVTLEDILEEIVGEIEDEFDLRKRHIRPVGRLETEVPGGLSLRDFNEKFSTALEAEQVGTIGGYVTARLGDFPKVGDKVACGAVTLLVKEVKRHRATVIVVQRAPW